MRWSVLMAALILAPMTGSTAPPAGEALMCTLDADALARRKALAAELIGRGVLAWAPIEGGARLSVKVGHVTSAIELVMLERRCCAGVNAVFTLPPEGDAATLDLSGPKAFQAELRGLLAHAPTSRTHPRK